jgi:glyoxylase-like metal-dependent hydrolase (beta-lactamase superfamily II)
MMSLTKFLAAATLFACPVLASADPGVPVERFESPGHAPVNSWRVGTTDGGVIVFDTLRTLSDARAAISEIKERGRPVRAIFITHPHPDHVTGLGTFKTAFPDVPIYSTHEGDAWLRAHGRDILHMNVEAREPGDATEDIPAADHSLVDGQMVTIGGTQIKVLILGDAESPAAVAYFIPEGHLLVSGDVMTPRRTPLLAAGHTERWLAQIARLRKAFPADTRVLPGHGPETTLSTAADWQSHFIEQFRALAARAADTKSPAGACIDKDEAASLLEQMNQRWPTDGVVAKMPVEVLNQLNIEGVGHELGAAACEGRENPVREH